MKKTLIGLICLLFSLSLILSGCGNEGAPEGYSNVASDNEAFYLYVPSAWVSNSSGGTASAYYSSSDLSNVSFTCMVIDPGTTDTLETYKQLALKEFSDVLPGFKEVASEPRLDENGAELPAPTIDGRETLILEYECTLGEEHYKYKQAVTMKDDFFYILTYTALAENYEAHLEEVDSIIGYVRFK